jgi:hypothetical protein
MLLEFYFKLISILHRVNNKRIGNFSLKYISCTVLNINIKKRGRVLVTNHVSRKLKFAIFENFTNNGESIRDINEGSRE